MESKFHVKYSLYNNLIKLTNTLVRFIGIVSTDDGFNYWAINQKD